MLKDKNEIIEKLSDTVCGVCIDGDEYAVAEAVYTNGYRKVSDTTCEFVKRFKRELEKFVRYDHEDDVPYYDASCEQIDDLIDYIAEQINDEVHMEK